MKFSLTLLAYAAAASVCEHTQCTYESMGEGLFRTRISTDMGLENFSCGKVDGPGNTCTCMCSDDYKCTLDHATADGTRVQRHHCDGHTPTVETEFEMELGGYSVESFDDTAREAVIGAFEETAPDGSVVELTDIRDASSGSRRLVEAETSGVLFNVNIVAPAAMASTVMESVTAFQTDPASLESKVEAQLEQRGATPPADFGAAVKEVNQSAVLPSQPTAPPTAAPTYGCQSYTLKNEGDWSGYIWTDCNGETGRWSCQGNHGQTKVVCASDIPRQTGNPAYGAVGSVTLRSDNFRCEVPVEETEFDMELTGYSVASFDDTAREAVTAALVKIVPDGSAIDLNVDLSDIRDASSGSRRLVEAESSGVVVKVTIVSPSDVFSTIMAGVNAILKDPALLESEVEVQLERKGATRPANFGAAMKRVMGCQSYTLKNEGDWSGFTWFDCNGESQQWSWQGNYGQTKVICAGSSLPRQTGNPAYGAAGSVTLESDSSICSAM